ncbi:polysaccharide deacetylase family protein [Streptomyces sp. SID13031]|uniref:polysaccharide deacetylase family protein n=1 Tax=Streptomyces sp. SID13031 TaxID=2706046 RepID=UPI0013CAE067|nr:polysaccharide deacetylase family protein [Streptomyces sp. SID13031]
MGETAVSLTFNDGLRSQYQYAGPVLKSHNVNGTFYVSSRIIDANAPGYFATWDADSLYRDGNEIGGLSKDHIDLTDPSTTQAYKQDQVCSDKQRLTNLGYDPVSFSYPFAAVDANAGSIVQGCGYLSGRTVGGLAPTSAPFAESRPPVNPFWVSTANFGSGPLQLADLQNAVNVASSNGGGWVPLAFNYVCQPGSPEYADCMGTYQALDTTVLGQFIDWLQSTGAPAGTTIEKVRDVMGAGPQPVLPPRPTQISLTFDDGLLSHYGLRSMLASHGVHGTFYINSGNVENPDEDSIMTWAEITNLKNDGNDIGGHTKDHMIITDPATTFDYKWHQVCDDRAKLQQQGFSPTSFAYPEAAFNPEAISIVKGCGYQTGRSGGTILVGGPVYTETVPPRDPFALYALGTTFDGPVSLQSLIDATNGAADHAGGWVPMLFHEICYQGTTNYAACMADYRPVDSVVISQFLDWAATQTSRGISIKSVAEVMNGTQAVPNPIISTPTANQTVNVAPTVTGTGSATGGDVTVSVYSGSYSTGNPIQTANATNTAGTWSVALTGPLANGIYTLQAQQTGAGLTGYSSPRTFVVNDAADVTAPVIQITAPVNGSSRNTTQPVISGTGGKLAGDAATTAVSIFNGATATGTPRSTTSVAISATGTWTLTPAALPQGTYTAQATQSDTAGNVGTSTSTFTVDTVKPIVRITSPVNNAAVTTTSFTVAGTTGVLAGDSPTVTLKVYAGSNTSGAVVSTLTSTATAGAWNATVAGLATGTYTLSASTTDAAGNIGLSPNVIIQLRSAMTVTSLSPNAFSQGLTGRAVAINGTGFTAASVPSFPGAGVTMTSYTFVSATRINVVLNTAANATVARSNVVVSRAGTVDAVCANCLILNAAPKVTGASPSTVARGLFKAFAINGSGFTAASQVTFSGGSGINILVISRSANLINITTSSISGSPGVRNITVTNPDGGVSTCVGCLTIT